MMLRNVRSKSSEVKSKHLPHRYPTSSHAGSCGREPARNGADTSARRPGSPLSMRRSSSVSLRSSKSKSTPWEKEFEAFVPADW